MENLSATRAIKKPSISISLFATLSESFSFDTKPSPSSVAKSSPRNFRGDGGGVVGLGIVAAMTGSSSSHEAFASANPYIAVSPKSSPIPIVSSAKAAANFRGGRNYGDLDPDDEEEVVDESSESYTCVISHHGNNLVTKRVYFGDNKVDNGGCDDACVVTCSRGVFSASPTNIGELETEFWTSDFLNSCFLCKKQLHGLDIFMYRGEKAFCSCDCRDRHIRSEDYKEKCRSEAMKPLDYPASPCSSPQVFLAGVAAA
ncbi:uncharacterized protein LOC112093685 isoform X2 [Morus notabilis]|uniref:uncharacterized protein LOC112093685 isoform X2 n=1 Tax=Morus notabilis TaxID=981085 RepID=UPI000CECF672|nr:uncharacterized protein LOC112093685 isoform X2 [Morus notabilis]